MRGDGGGGGKVVNELDDARGDNMTSDDLARLSLWPEEDQPTEEPWQRINYGHDDLARRLM